MISEDEITFLRESNAIEGVWDDRSLDLAVEAWEYLKARTKLTLAVIKKTHKLLMKEHMATGELAGWAGKLRSPGRTPTGGILEGRVFVGGEEKKSWVYLPDLLENWCRRANEHMSEGHIQTHHVEYEDIHPFYDGNGRTGRMFMNWQRYRSGLSFLILWEEEKFDVYYKWFKKPSLSKQRWLNSQI